MATKPIARSSTCDPNWLIVSADHSFRKSRWRQRPPLGQSRMSGVGWGERIGDAGKRRPELGRPRLVLDRLGHLAEMTLG